MSESGNQSIASGMIGVSKVVGNMKRKLKRPMTGNAGNNRRFGLLSP